MLRDIWGLSVITSDSRELSKIINHHKSIGIQHLQMELVRGSKENKFTINIDNVDDLIQEYRKLTNLFLDEIDTGSFENLKLILNENDYFGKLITRIIHGGRVYYRCMAGIGKLNFDAQGNIYPCEFFVGKREYRIGNIYDGIDKSSVERFYDENVDIRSKCKECWAKYLCGGDCYMNSYLVNGDMYIPDEVFCKFNKKMIEFAIVIMMSLRKKGILKECANFIRMRKILTNAAGGSTHESRENT